MRSVVQFFVGFAWGAFMELCSMTYKTGLPLE